MVEDVEVNQDIARAVLERAGHRVHIVGDGADAVAAVQQQPFDLVLMDIQMPGMDGLTATRLIRELAGPVHDIPVVAMTANVLPAQIIELRAAGMDDHVGKPFKRQELYATVDRWAARAAAKGLAPRVTSRLRVKSFGDDLGQRCAGKAGCRHRCSRYPLWMASV